MSAEHKIDIKIIVQNEKSASFCMNQRFSDITLIVGQEPNQKRIPAHRFALCSKSAVFNKMLINDLALNLKELELPDECPQAFEIVLKHMYDDDYELKEEILTKTIYSAKKYDLFDLENECIDHIKLENEESNSFLFYEITDHFGYNDLKRGCLHRINRDLTDSLNLHNMMSMSSVALSKLLIEPNLMVEESKLFQMVHLWSEFNCNKRGLEKSAQNKLEVLDGVLDKIRFPLMNANTFNRDVVPTGLLNRDQLFELFQWFAVDEKPNMIRFCAQPRRQLSDREYRLERFDKLDNVETFDRVTNLINFKVNRDIYLTRIHVFHFERAIDNEQQPTCYLTVRIGDFVYHEDFRSLPFYANSYSCDYSLRTPIRIEANDEVEIELECFYDFNFFYGTGGKSMYQVQLDNGENVTFHFNATDKSYNPIICKLGQFPYLDFKIASN